MTARQKRATEIILGVIIGSAIICIPYAIPAYSDWRFDRRQASQVVDDIQRGVLVADAHGIVKLPKRYAALGYNGEAYTARKPGLLLVFFTTFKIRGQWRGFLYCSRPLTSSDKWRGGDSIKMPVFGMTSATIPLTRQINAHWWQCIHAGTG